MKRLILLVLFVALASGTAWAGVRLDWDDSTRSATGRPEGLFTTAGTGGEATALVLGEVSTGEQTPSLTFFLSEVEAGVVQTRSLLADLTSSQTSAQTFDRLDFDASSSTEGGSQLVRYEWDMNGDGEFEKSTTIPTLEYSYSDDGIFFPRVRVIDESGEFDISEPLRIVIDNRPPLADFKADTNSAAEGTPIQFSNLSLDEDGQIVSWLYSFGDGSQSSAENPSHTYGTAGVYQVTLTVMDDDGATSQRELQISISNVGPQAAFTLQQSRLSVGEQLIIVNESLDLSEDGIIVHVAWDFGDGTYLAGGPSSDGIYAHTFAQPGTYTIELFVIDNDGSMARTQSTVTVL